MRCQKIPLTLLLLTLFPATLIAWLVVPAAADTLQVPQEYQTIQAAVNAAGTGDIIEVDAGTYPENVIVNQTVTIKGDSPTSTVVDGGGNHVVFNIQEDNVELCNLTVQNGGSYSGVTIYYPYSGLTIRNTRIIDNVVGVVVSEADGNTIEDNVFINNQMYGIDVTYSSNTIIRDNQISESAYGVEASDTSSSQVVNNTISDTSYSIYVPYSNNNNISANTLTSNSWNIYLTYSNSNIIGHNKVLEGTVGIQVMHSEGNSILNNTVTDSSYGIYVGYCSTNTVSGNTATLNDWGIELYNSTGSTIIGNLIEDNTWGAWIAENSDGNSIYHNNFMDNAKGAFQDLTSKNSWNTPAIPYQGNYWDNYKGADTDGDGTGDTWLPWEGVDWHPLMNPYGIYHDVAITSVTPSPTHAYVGKMVNITVVAENQGTSTETFNVTTRYENTTLGIFETVGTQEVTSLAPEQNVILTFTWNTTDAQPCVYYTIKAEASTVPGEIDTTDNTYTDGTVKIKIEGDINGDGIVDIADLTIVAVAYGLFEGEPGYDPEADLNKDGIIDIADISIVTMYYGNTC
jgi:parallel beta-helix repeat protein